jgi:hypothetical protein
MLCKFSTAAASEADAHILYTLLCKQVVAKYLVLMLQCWPAAMLEKEVAQLQAGILVSLSTGLHHL